MPFGSNCSSYFSGDAKINGKQNKLQVGTTFDKVSIEIIEMPHVNSSGNWECNLNETVYIKN